MKYKKKQFIISFLTFGLLSSIFLSCTKTNIQFGSQFADDQYTQIIQFDTITPLLSTIYIDSFTTSNSGTAMAGTFVDPKFGTTTTSSYFQLGPPSYDATTTKYNNAIYDSITLNLKFKKGRYYGDTTKSFVLNVYPLTQKITPPNSGTALFNTTSFSASNVALGSFSKIIQPNNIYTSDTISIRLNDDFGKDLLKKLQTRDPAIQSNDQFVTFFQGIKLSGGNAISMALGLSDSVEMRLYFKTPSVPEAKEQYATFGMNNSSLQFNNIKIQRTGALQQAGIGIQNKEIPSGLTDSTSFLQPITGTVIKVTFPTISTLQLKSGFIQLASALLYIRPAKGTYEGMFTLPAELNLATTDLNNKIGTALTNASTGTAQNGQLTLDYLNQTGLGSYYIFDVTSYLRSIITDQQATILKKGLLLTPPSDSLFNTFNRLIAGDGKNTNAKLTLQIKYISVK